MCSLWFVKIVLTVREFAEEVGICKSSCHLILTENGIYVVSPQNLCRVCWRVTPCPWIFEEPWKECCPSAALLPDLTTADFFVFPKRKSSLKGRRFQTVEEIEENSIRDLRAVPQNAFQKWGERERKNVGSVVSTVEGSALKAISLILL